MIVYIIWLFGFWYMWFVVGVFLKLQTFFKWFYWLTLSHITVPSLLCNFICIIKFVNFVDFHPPFGREIEKQKAKFIFNSQTLYHFSLQDLTRCQSWIWCTTRETSGFASHWTIKWFSQLYIFSNSLYPPVKLKVKTHVINHLLVFNLYKMVYSVICLFL